MKRVFLGLTLLVSISFSADLNYNKNWKLNEPTLQKINVEADKVNQKMKLKCGENEFITSLNRLTPLQSPLKLQIVSICKNKNVIDVTNFESVLAESK